jgi:hypothetical protein
LAAGGGGHVDDVAAGGGEFGGSLVAPAERRPRKLTALAESAADVDRTRRVERLDRDLSERCRGMVACRGVVTADRSDVVSELCEGVVVASGDSDGKFRGAFGVGPDVRRARPSADSPGRVSGRKP